MNSLLAKHRPKDLTKEKWEQTWDNSSYVLQPLAEVLKEMKAELGKVKPDDFKDPNHYPKLVSELMQKQLIERILDLLPGSVDKK